jgi:hypothetical protein
VAAAAGRIVTEHQHTIAAHTISQLFDGVFPNNTTTTNNDEFA